MGLEDVCYVLSSVGVPARVHGRQYIIKAVDIIMNDEEAAFAMTKRVYMRVADDYNIDHKQVENSIRTAIERAWKTGRCERHENIFGYSRTEGKRPSNSEFILRLAEYLQAGNN